MAYCDSTDLKRWLSISDSNDDAILDQCADAASAMIDAYCGRTFTVASGTSVWYPERVGYCVDTPDFATTSGLVVETTSDHTTWVTLTSNTDYVVYPLNRGPLELPYNQIRFNRQPVYPTDNRPTMRITAPWGWAFTPEPVVTGSKVQSAKLFRRKDTPDGLAGGGDFGVIRVNSKIDPTVAEALNPYRRGGYAQGLVVG